MEQIFGEDMYPKLRRHFFILDTIKISSDKTSLHSSEHEAYLSKENEYNAVTGPNSSYSLEISLIGSNVIFKVCGVPITSTTTHYI